MYPREARSRNPRASLEIVSRIVAFGGNRFATEYILVEPREQAPIARNQIRVNVLRCDAQAFHRLRRRPACAIDLESGSPRL